MSSTDPDALTGAEIAVIGIACRMPGADDIEAYWQNLRAGVESVTFFTDAELLAAGIDPRELKAPNYVRANAILTDFDQFDAAFFGIGGQEAQLTDPQHRIFLECAHTALEHAGVCPTGFAGSIGVFAGAGMNGYLLKNLYPNREHLAAVNEFQIMIWNDKDHLATKSAYKLNLRGPCVTVQTACSTSLVAVHLACQSLLNGECDLALAGGVSLRLPQIGGYLYQEGMVESPDGHCRVFDAQGQGFAHGSGVGVVVLRPLTEALEARDHIHAVIKGTAINNDGSAKVGYAAPGVDGQARVIAEAQAVAEVDPDSITYVEAHGTATPLGDPIEVAALTQAFRAGTERTGYCALGAVKSNFGHLDAAAGAAGFIKTVLALEHQEIPPSLNFSEPNPQLDLANSPFFVNTVLRDWEAADHPRRAGVSSFGQGGTNAHAVLEEAPPVPDARNPIERPAQLLTLSAKTESALVELARRYAAYLAGPPDTALADICFTANAGRCHFAHRLATVANSVRQLQAQLAAFAAGKSPAAISTGQIADNHLPQLTFVFADVPAALPTAWRQEIGELAASQPRLAHVLDRGDPLTTSLFGRPCREILSAPPDDTVSAAARPMVYCLLVYGLADLLQYWGIVPDTVAGHGYGEYVAAAVAGVLPLEQALKLAAIAAGRERSIQVQEGEIGVELHLGSPRRTLISMSTGTVVGTEVTAPEYWHRFNPRTDKETRRLSGVKGDDNDLRLRIGPAAASEPEATRHAPPEADWRLPGWLPTETPWQYLLDRLATLYAAGAAVDWTAFEAPYRRRRVVLPTYPFQRRRYWVDEVSPPETKADEAPTRKTRVDQLPTTGIRANPVDGSQGKAPPPATAAVDLAAPPLPPSRVADYGRIIELQIQAASEAVSLVVSKQLQFLSNRRGGVALGNPGPTRAPTPGSTELRQVTAVSAPAMASAGQAIAPAQTAGTRATPAEAAREPEAAGGWPRQPREAQPPPETQAPQRQDWQLWAISSPSEEGLEEETRNLIQELRAETHPGPAAVFNRRPAGHAEGSWRRTLVAQGRDRAAELLASRDANRVHDHRLRPPALSLAFMLPGIGEQYPNMARDLYESEPIFRDHFDRGRKWLQTCCGVDLLPELYPPRQAAAQNEPELEAEGIDLRRLLDGVAHDPGGDPSALNQTSLAHPAVFIVEYALARVWSNWGISPRAMIGHSLGEYVAACLAGVMRFEEGLQLVARRAALIQELPPGAMLAVPLDEAAVLPLLGEHLFLAALNTPSLSVVSGTGTAVAKLEARLRDQGVLSRRLRATHPFHSPLMEPITDGLAAELAKIELRPPRIPYLSNVTGDWIKPEQATDPTYWLGHTCQPVRFCEGIEALLRETAYVLLEVGPGQSLGSFVWQHAASAAHPEMLVLPSLPSAHERPADKLVLLSSLAKLWLHGSRVRETRIRNLTH